MLGNNCLCYLCLVSNKDSNESCGSVQAITQLGRGGLGITSTRRLLILQYLSEQLYNKLFSESQNRYKKQFINHFKTIYYKPGINCDSIAAINFYFSKNPSSKHYALIMCADCFCPVFAIIQEYDLGIKDSKKHKLLMAYSQLTGAFLATYES